MGDKKLKMKCNYVKLLIAKNSKVYIFLTYNFDGVSRTKFNVLNIEILYFVKENLYL